jgi:heme-degrading monooxygenase HmoA
MYIVMNRFRIVAGKEGDFEESWRNRESHLKDFAGFQRFALLKNEQAADGTVEYISHTTWADRAAFENWRASQQFNRAHGGAQVEGVIAGPPQVSMYEAVLVEAAESVST